MKDEELIELRKKGLTIRQLATLDSVSYSSMQRRLRLIEKKSAPEFSLQWVMFEVEAPEPTHDCGPDCYCWNQKKEEPDAIDKPFLIRRTRNCRRRGKNSS